MLKTNHYLLIAFVLFVSFVVMPHASKSTAGSFPAKGVTPDVAVAWATEVIESNHHSPADNILGAVDGQWAIGFPGGGTITVSFDKPITNGPGPDFAVWENGFAVQEGLLFVELAYVNVSSDGNTWVTFPSVFLEDPNANLIADPTEIYNLAGNYIAHYVSDEHKQGTPFDLEDLMNLSEVQSGQVDLNTIQYVRLRDILGVSEGGNAYDQATYFGYAENHVIDDGISYGGGADWDAVGVINEFKLSADFNGDLRVDWLDLWILQNAWLSQPSDSHWNPLCDLFSSKYDMINFHDYTVFTDQWLLP
jgi:hypothetical protein